MLTNNYSLSNITDDFCCPDDVIRTVYNNTTINLFITSFIYYVADIIYYLFWYKFCSWLHSKYASIPFLNTREIHPSYTVVQLQAGVNVLLLLSTKAPNTVSSKINSV